MGRPTTLELKQGEDVLLRRIEKTETAIDTVKDKYNGRVAEKLAKCVDMLEEPAAELKKEKATPQKIQNHIEEVLDSIDRVLELATEHEAEIFSEVIEGPLQGLGNVEMEIMNVN
jgi:molecular chaperone GrpE (heat shock protein)